MVENDKISMIIGADLVPTPSNFTLFENSDINVLYGKQLLAVLKSADYRIFNLETPICDIEKPIHKCGPTLRAPRKTMSGIKAINPSLLTLANNHIMDQGIEGYKSTIQELAKNEIPFVGAGDNKNCLFKSYVFSNFQTGIKIGVYACCEIEYSIAKQDYPGANPYDPLDSFDDIAELKANCDYVVVLYHGGKEFYRYPSPGLKRVCEKMIDKGADIVITQHSHCVGCEEHYHNGIVVYGQGNFLFDGSKSEAWDTSLLVDVQFSNKIQIQYTPLVRVDNKVRVANNSKANEILNGFYERSEKIKNEKFVTEEYQNFADQYLQMYYNAFSGKVSHLLLALSRFLDTKIMGKNFAEAHRLDMIDYLCCDSHRELFTQGLANTIRQDQKRNKNNGEK